jgi:hypothetical protein
MTIQEFTTIFLSREHTQSVILGILVASAFPIGAAVAIVHKFPRRLKGNLAAIGAGIYFSTLAFSLIEEAIKVCHRLRRVHIHVERGYFLRSNGALLHMLC